MPIAYLSIAYFDKFLPLVVALVVVAVVVVPIAARTGCAPQHVDGHELGDSTNVTYCIKLNASHKKLRSNQQVTVLY